jgi:hypothetical protein
MLFRIALIAGAFTLATVPAQAQTLEKAPPGGNYKKPANWSNCPISCRAWARSTSMPGPCRLVPFLAYDHDGKLVSTIYMIPAEDLQAKKKFDDLQAAGGTVDHVDMYFNAGHPGVEKPHYHVVLWHVTKADEARVAK